MHVVTRSGVQNQTKCVPISFNIVKIHSITSSFIYKKYFSKVTIFTLFILYYTKVTIFFIFTGSFFFFNNISRTALICASLKYCTRDIAACHKK